VTSRRAVVTGASRGIGRALTEHLCAAGQAVAIIGRSPSDLAEAASQTAGVPFVLDVASPIAVNGGSAFTWEINVRGTFICTGLALEPMMARGSGRIINLSSGVATYPVGLDRATTVERPLTR
jgi:NAD(P)-dependent dehydrogenase (short-subunit alcohol dehydrogenase family)